MSLGQKKKVLDFGIDYDLLSNLTENYVSSDIESIVNEATSIAMADDSRITMQLLEKIIKILCAFSKIKKIPNIKAKMDGVIIEKMIDLELVFKLLIKSDMETISFDRLLLKTAFCCMASDGEMSTKRSKSNKETVKNHRSLKILILKRNKCINQQIKFKWQRFYKLLF